MSTIDTPDNQRGVVAPARLLGSFESTTLTAIVTLPANAAALWIFVGPAPDTPDVIVYGTSTHQVFPSYLFAADDDNDAQPAILAVVAPTVDDSVTITFASDPGAQWYVVADAGPRIVVDAALAGTVASPGHPVVGSAVQVAGTDGTDARILLTDDDGRLLITSATFPPVYAAPGAPLPADALLIGGSDGSDIQALATDGGGILKVSDADIEDVVGTPSATKPIGALQVGGNDGSDLYAMLVDTAGHPLTIDQMLKLCIAVSGAAAPADVVMVAGSNGTDAIPIPITGGGALAVQDTTLEAAAGAPSAAKPNTALQAAGNDGTDLRVLRTDQQGIAYVIPSAPNIAAGDHPPNEILSAAAGFSASGVLLAAAGAGKRYRIYAAQIAGQAAGMNYFLQDGVSGALICVGAGEGVTSLQLPLSGYAMAANAALNYELGGGSGNADAVVFYTLETI